jgi:hypothetical protein
MLDVEKGGVKRENALSLTGRYSARSPESDFQNSGGRRGRGEEGV